MFRIFLTSAWSHVPFLGPLELERDSMWGRCLQLEPLSLLQQGGQGLDTGPPRTQTSSQFSSRAHSPTDSNPILHPRLSFIFFLVGQTIHENEDRIIPKLWRQISSSTASFPMVKETYGSRRSPKHPRYIHTQCTRIEYAVCKLIVPIRRQLGSATASFWVNGEDEYGEVRREGDGHDRDQDCYYRSPLAFSCAKWDNGLDAWDFGNGTRFEGGFGWLSEWVIWVSDGMSGWL